MRLGSSLLCVLVGLAACATPTPRVAPTSPPTAGVPAAQAPPAPAPTAAPARAAPLSPPATVRLGLLLTLSDAGVFIGLERGYFAEEGLELELIRIDGAAQAMPHLATGQLDAAGITPSAAFFNAVSRGLPLRIAADKSRQTAQQSSGTWVLRTDVAASGAVRDWADLRGLNLGINVPDTGTVTDIQLDRALERGGLTRDDVHIVALPYADMNTALGSQAVDAAYHVEPFVTLGENLGVLRRWRTQVEGSPDQYTTVWVYSPTFAETEAAYRFVTAYLRGVRDFNDAFLHGRDKPAVVDILTRHTPVKDTRLYDQMGFAAMDPDGHVRPELIAEDIKYYLAKGYMQQAIDPRQVIDQRYVDYALARLGPYRPPAP